MSFEYIIDNFVPEKVPTKKDFISMYKKYIQCLNEIKCYRIKYYVFGAMLVHSKECYENNDDIKTFTSKYLAVCKSVVDFTYSEIKKGDHEVSTLLECTLAMLGSLLHSYIEAINYEDDELKGLLLINNKFEEGDETK